MAPQPDRLKRPYHHWTPEDDAILRRDYRGSLANRQALARRLGVTEGAVHSRAAVLGCQRDTYTRRPWTEEEVEQLRELVGRLCTKAIARRLHRSANSVAVRAKRLRLSHRARNGWYTQGETAEILGVSDRWVTRQIEAGHLRASWHHGQKAHSSPRHIGARDLRQFIIESADLLVARNVDLVQVVFLLVEEGKT